MDDCDNLNWFPLPDVADDVRVEVPETIAPVQKLLMVVADAGRLTQFLKRFMNFGPKAFQPRRGVLGDVEQDLAEVGFRFRGEKRPE